MSAFGPFDDDGPTMVPVVPPTRFSHTPRPTHHFEHTPRPTAPSPSPTINYWASKEGKSIATSSACAVVLVLMVLAFMLAVDRYRRRKDAMKSTGGRDRRIGSNASSLAERWSTQFGFRSGNTEGLSATEGEESINGGGLRRGCNIHLAWTSSKMPQQCGSNVHISSEGYLHIHFSVYVKSRSAIVIAL